MNSASVHVCYHSEGRSRRAEDQEDWQKKRIPKIMFITIVGTDATSEHCSASVPDTDKLQQLHNTWIQSHEAGKQ